MTLVLTTHYMDEAEQLCDRLVVMDAGRIVAEGSPRRADRASTRTREVLELRFARRQQTATRRDVAGIGERVELLPDRVLVYVDDGDAGRSRRCTPAGVTPEARWCGAARWRTCSCTHRAGSLVD